MNLNSVKKQCLLALIPIIVISCKPEYRRVEIKYPDGVVGVVIEYPHRDDSLNYTITVYYPNGAIRKQLKVENGKYVGNKTTYFKNGKIEQVDSLLNPCDTSAKRCDGILTHYYDNGNIANQYVVRNGAFNGSCSHYDSNGVKIKEYELINDSIKDGLYREFYNNGHISYKVRYKNNIPTGFAYYFNEKGDTVKYHSHYEGVLDLPYKIWLENGQTLVGVYADKSEKKVVWKWFDKNGKEVKKKISDLHKDGYAVPN